MHSLLDLNLAAELHRGRSAGTPKPARFRRPTERPAAPVAAAERPEIHRDPTD